MKSHRLNQVTVRVPGSTSNCGAGFDTLGLALSIYNNVTLARGYWHRARAASNGEIAGLEMANEAAALFFLRTGVEEFGFELGIKGDVPMSRGLGSSVTLRAGVVAGLNELAGTGLTKEDLCSLVTQLEGHPDNATPAVIGGFCVARSDPHTGELLGVLRQPIGRDLCFVVVSPDQELETKKARGILPKELPYFDAIKSVNSAAYVVAAILSGEYDRLRHAVMDFLHEPYRLPLIPGAKLTKDDLCSLVTQLEGHPDNATPAVIGGFCVARCDAHTGELLGVVRKPIGRDLVFVVVTPDQELET